MAARHAGRTTSAAARRRRCARRSRSSRSSPGRPLEIRDHPAVPGDQRRTKADTSLIRARARLGADDVAARGSRGPVGSGPLLGSRRDEREQSARSRRRAGGRSPLRVDADHGALVAAGRRARDRRRARRARLGRRRRRLPRHDAPLPRPAVHDLGRRPDPEPRDEPEDREPDHPLRGGAAAGRGGERAHASASCAATSPRQAIVTAGQAQEHLAARRDHGRRARGRQGGEGGRLARRLGRSASSRPTSTRRSTLLNKQIVVEQVRARRASTSASRTPSRSSRR